jgi:glutamine synthetase
VLKSADIADLFKRTGVLTPVELESRFEVYAEQYVKSIDVEAKLVINMAKTVIYPAAIAYLSQLSSTMQGLVAMGVNLDKERAQTVGNLLNTMMASVSKLSAAASKHDFGSTEAHMQHCAGTIRSLMDEVRQSADALEAEIGDEFWPLPTYQEMLFIK